VSAQAIAVDYGNRLWNILTRLLQHKESATSEVPLGMKRWKDGEIHTDEFIEIQKELDALSTEVDKFANTTIFSASMKARVEEVCQEVGIEAPKWRS